MRWSGGTKCPCQDAEFPLKKVHFVFSVYISLFLISVDGPSSSNSHYIHMRSTIFIEKLMK